MSSTDWWQGYSKKEPNPLYRTTAQDYGAEKPNIHTMPTVYRTQSSAFTEVNDDHYFSSEKTIHQSLFALFQHLGKCGIYRYQGLNTAVDKGRFIDKF